MTLDELDPLLASACKPVGTCVIHRAPGADGYPVVGRKGKTYRANRWVLALKLGRPIGPKLMACHTCDTPACLNPEHLFEGTNSINQLDSAAKGRHRGCVEKCMRGHSLMDEKNVRLVGNKRKCRACESRRMRISRGYARPEDFDE